MKDLSQNLTLIDLIRKLVAYKWRVIIITFAVTLIGTIYIISLPRGYTARTKIVVERKGNQNFGSLGVLGGLNLGSNLSDGLTIELAPAIVKSSSFLLEFYDMEVELMSGRKGRLAFSNYLENFQKKTLVDFFLVQKEKRNIT
ncbi:Wzz/FepE/Etk N-terminal domain-containing protein [Bacteroides thetaiotaomicron]|uniref:Wzz/FepE/Etk N-terminal domain-containing protein n=1 Tax=Bacteroides thetaiotaomicron TaxID=818 RepID=UPI0039C2B9E9